MYIYLYIHIFLSFVCFSLLGLWTSLSELKSYVCMYVCLMHLLSVISMNVAINHICQKLDFLDYISVEDNLGVDSTNLTR